MNVSAVSWLIILLLVTLLLTFLRSRRVTGWLGERRVARILGNAARRNAGRLFTDLTLPAGDGTTQIDALLVSPAAIYVVEVKTLRGRISGGPQKKRWRQQLGRRGYYFQNPLHQNHAHLKTVQALLGIERKLLKPVVVFAGKSQTTRKIDALVTSPRKLEKQLAGNHSRLIADDEIERLAAEIERLRLPPGRATNRAHRLYVRTKLAKEKNES